MNEVIAWAGFAGAWRLPPAMYVLRRRSNRAFRQATFAQLTPAQREQFTSFRNKATGWYTVAAGAFLQPGGQLRFYEHVRSRDRLFGRYQRAADLAWPHLMGGCHV